MRLCHATSYLFLLDSPPCCFATDTGGKRPILVKGSKTKANCELALQRLAALLAARPNHDVAPANVTVAEIIDWFLANCAARLAAGEIKRSTLESFYRPYGRLIKQECGDWLANRIDDVQVRAYRIQLNRRSLSSSPYCEIRKSCERLTRRVRRKFPGHCSNDSRRIGSSVSATS